MDAARKVMLSRCSVAVSNLESYERDLLMGMNFFILYVLREHGVFAS